MLLAESAAQVMHAAAAASHPLETGGILVGVYVRGQPWVTAAIEIPSEERGVGHYRLPGRTTRAAVIKAQRTDSRVGYLGDWHSHPRDIGPSAIDIGSLAMMTMAHIATPNPLLIVVRRRDCAYALDVRRMRLGVPISCAVTLSGDLSPEQH
ncbi:Mov34/MPN/PAD-1 family protein [Mycobacterium intracellulare]|uniref:Mov34/MPN/PAD-1 family protein n=1 Tax=Mycobacterium avium complex (MAC) TaxID=120793 RepID=UPI0034D20411